MLGLRFCARAFSSCGKWGPLFIAVRGPLTIVACLVAEHRLQTCRLSSCGSRAQSLRGMWDLPRPGLEPVSPALAGRFSTTAPPGKPQNIIFPVINLGDTKNYLGSFKNPSVRTRSQANKIRSSSVGLSKSKFKVEQLVPGCSQGEQAGSRHCCITGTCRKHTACEMEIPEGSVHSAHPGCCDPLAPRPLLSTVPFALLPQWWNCDSFFVFCF